MRPGLPGFGGKMKLQNGCGQELGDLGCGSMIFKGARENTFILGMFLVNLGL